MAFLALANHNHIDYRFCSLQKISALIKVLRTVPKRIKKAAPAKPRARQKRGRAATEETQRPKKRAAAEEAARRLSSR